MSFLEDLKGFSNLPPARKVGAVVVLLVIFSLGTIFGLLFFPKKTAPPEITLPPASKIVLPFEEQRGASFSLSPQNQEVSKGATFTVTINFDSGESKVEAADCVLKYDPKILRVNKIIPGLIFPQYPRKEVREDKIFLSGTIGVEKSQREGVNGQGPLGSIEFKAIQTGNTSLEFVREETIIASHGENILEKVQNVFLSIK